MGDLEIQSMIEEYLCEPKEPDVVTAEVPGPRSMAYLDRLEQYQDTRTCQVVMDSQKSVGNYLVDIDGNTLLDFHSQIGSIPIGYNNPAFEERFEQDNMLKHILNRPALGVFPPEYHLSAVEKIMSKAPMGLGKVFLSTSGSDVNEIAFKLAFMKYQRDRRGGQNIFTEKELTSSLINALPGTPELCIMSFRGGYHGKLLGTLSTTHSNPIHKVDVPAFKWPIAPFPQLRYPLDDPENIIHNSNEETRCLLKVEEIIITNKVPVAGLIVEPIQGNGGDNHATHRFFQELRAITKRYNVAFIVDEVQTGVGGTGRFWAHEHWNLTESPDIVTFSKKMQAAGLYYRAEYLASHPFRNFNTWMGDPLGILKASIIIDYIDKHNLLSKVTKVGEYLLSKLKQIDRLSNVRGCGALIAFDVENEEFRDKLVTKMRNKGVLINGCAKKGIRLRPMLIYDFHHVDEFMRRLSYALSDALSDTLNSDLDSVFS